MWLCVCQCDCDSVRLSVWLWFCASVSDCDSMSVIDGPCLICKILASCLIIMSVRTNCRCVCRSVSVRIGCLCLSSCFYITLIFLYVYFNCDLNVVLCVLYRERTVVLCVWDRLVSVRSCVLQLTSLCGRPPSALVWALPVVHCLDLGSFWRAWISGLAAFQTVTWQRTPDTVCTTRRDHWSSYLFFFFFFLSSPKLLEPF